MRPVTPRIVALTASVLLGIGVLAAAGPPASAASADVAISQVYGGGGNAGATFTNDFVELRNTSAAPVDLTGWSVQYASAAGTSYQLTALSGSIPAGGHYLVQEAAGAGGTTPLPTPDATGSIAMAAASGKVALVTTATALACGADCDTAAGVRDFVGYGAANDFETAAAPGLTNTTADLRGDGPDTDNNAADFAAGDPNPRNTGGGGTPPDPGVPGLKIHDIQGAAQRSPKVGVKVAEVPGVVTTVSTNGFWFQDPTPDADPATSEGLFVFTRTAPTAAVGDAVTVTGTVSEFRPGGAATNLSTTELTNPVVTVTASGQALPAPTVVGPGGRVPPAQVIENDANGDVETTETAFDPANDGLDFWESLEGMRVSITDVQVVGPTNRFGETSVVPPGSTVRTGRGGIVLAGERPQPGADRARPDARRRSRGPTSATRTPGRRSASLDYNFGNFELLPSTAPTLVSGGLQREVTKTPNALQLSVATFNVENLAPTDPQTKFDTLAQYAVHNLQAPDILALEEIQDNSGAADDGVVAADQTIGKLTAAITAAGGPAYQSRVDRPGRRRRRRPAGRQHPGGVPVPDRPRADVPGQPGRYVDGRDHGRAGQRPAGRTCRSRRAASTRPARPGPTAASRWRASSAGAAGRSSSSRTTSSPRAATTRCTGGSSRSSSPRRSSGCSRRPRCATSSTRSWPPTGTRTSWSSVTSTTSTSPPRSTR